MTEYKHMIKNVAVFKNGMIMTFDQHGQQMPSFQGEQTFKLMKKIKDRITRQKTPVSWHWKVPFRKLEI